MTVAAVTAAAVLMITNVGAAVSLSLAFAGVLTVAVLEERLAERMLAK